MFVLVIDGDEDLRVAVCELLRAEGHEPRAFPHGRAALTALGGGARADMIILDLRHEALASDDGAVAFRRQQLGDASLAEIPTVVLSILTHAERAACERWFGNVPIVSKPFTIEELLDAVAVAREGVRAVAVLRKTPPRGMLPRDAASALATFFALSEAEAMRVLERLVAPDAWEPGPADGIALLPVTAAAALGAKEAYLVWIRDGATYPFHQHAHDERKLLLRGGLRDDDGRECWAGERVDHRPGTAHASTAIGGGGCLLAALIVPV